MARSPVNQVRATVRSRFSVKSPFPGGAARLKQNILIRAVWQVSLSGRPHRATDTIAYTIFRTNDETPVPSHRGVADASCRGKHERTCPAEQTVRGEEKEQGNRAVAPYPPGVWRGKSGHQGTGYLVSNEGSEPIGDGQCHRDQTAPLRIRATE